MNEEKVGILIYVRDEATAALRGIGTNLNRTITNIGHDISKGVGTAIGNLEKLGLIAGGAFVGGVTMAVRAAGDFEAQLNIINTIARATPENLAKIGDSIRALAKETGTPLEDLTQAYYDLLSAGISAADATTVLRQANTLAIGGLATTAQTVDLLTTAINAYGGDASRAAEYTDYFAKAIEAGKVTAADISSSFANVGAIAAQSGIQVREIAAAYGYLTAQGVPAAEVTTQMSRAILELLSPTKAVVNLQDKFGRTYADIARQKGLGVALAQLRADAEATGKPLVDLFGRVEGYKYLLETTGEKQEGFNAALAQMGDSTGTAAGQAAERQKGLNYQIERLKANVHDAAITIGQALIPQLADLAEEAGTFLSGNEDGIKAFAATLAAGFRDAVAYARGLDWGAIASALQAGASAAKSLVEAFLSLPPDLRNALIGGFAVNKLTGGMLTDIGGHLLQGGIGLGARALLGGKGGGVGGLLGGIGVQHVWVDNMGIGGMGDLAGAGGGGVKGLLGKLGLLGLGVGLAEVVSLVNDEVTKNTNSQAAGVRSTASDWLAQNPTIEQLKSGYDATATGIFELKSQFFGLPDLLNIGGVHDAVTAMEAQQKDILAKVAELEFAKKTVGDPYETGPRSGGDSRPGTNAEWWKWQTTPGQDEATLRNNLYTAQKDALSAEIRPSLVDLGAQIPDRTSQQMIPSIDRISDRTSDVRAALDAQLPVLQLIAQRVGITSRDVTAAGATNSAFATDRQRQAFIDARVR